MNFPVVFPLGPWNIPAHPLFEIASYTLGFQLFLWQRRRAGDAVASHGRLWVIAGAIVGAAVGSKLVGYFVDPALTWAHLGDPVFMLAGAKTIVGGLAGGLLGVELVKKRLGITRSTGDLFALPLALGIALGRVGCFLTGLSDRTHGVATSLPWGIDFGDGVLRHPTQLYEIGWLLVLAAWIIWRGRRPHAEGALFQGFLAGYMAFRLLIDFIKPGVPLAGLTAIQWTCLAVLTYYALLAARGTPRAALAD